MDVVEYLSHQEVTGMLWQYGWSDNLGNSVDFEDAQRVILLLKTMGIKFYKTIEADIYGTKT